MDTRIPFEAARPAPDQGRAARRPHLRLRSGKQVIEILDLWSGGLTVASGAPRPARGVVDIFDGDRLLKHGLIYEVSETAEQRVYAFKSAQVADNAPPADFVRRNTLPVALIPAPARG